MKGLMFFGIVLTVAIIAVMFVALVAGIIWRVRYKKDRVKWLREKFQEWYPRFKAENFIPRADERSECCQAMLWKLSGSPPKYYCNKCGEENEKAKGCFKLLKR